jgi:hypothetical protein
MSAFLTVLSLGAGVQSSTLLLMAVKGEIEMDAAIFADTQWESSAIYAHLDWLETQAANAGIGIHRVTAGDLRADALAGKSASWMPMFSRDPATGQPQQLKRQCTRNYKIRPIRRKLRELGGGKLVRGRTIDQLIGISLDEWIRIRTSGAQYVNNVYPLVDRRITRAGCMAWLTHVGYPVPPKSACLGCPFHADSYYREMRESAPVEWAATVEFDYEMRKRRTNRGEPVYIHRSLLPLDEAIARDSGQLGLFDAECTGSCGV